MLHRFLLSEWHDYPDLLQSARRWSAITRLKTCSRPTPNHMDLPAWSGHRSPSDWCPAAGRRQIVLATDRNSGMLRLTTTRQMMMMTSDSKKSRLKYEIKYDLCYIARQTKNLKTLKLNFWCFQVFKKPQNLGFLTNLPSLTMTGTQHVTGRNQYNWLHWQSDN